MKTNTNDAARRSQTSISRATVREMDDQHLVQQVKQADVYHSETPTDFENFQPIGFTSYPVKQKQDQQGQQGGGGGGNGGRKSGDWNNNQPKGEAAEAIMAYINGSRSHPVCIGVDDRRIRPYQMSEGEGAHYSPDGSGQMLYHKADGVYLLSLDDQSSSGGGGQSLISQYAEEEREARGLPRDGQQQQTRKVSVRHVAKQKQLRKVDPNDKKKFPHEGSINTAMELTAQKIEYSDGGTNVGHYDRGGKDWLHHDGSGATHSMRADQGHSHIKHDGAHVWANGVCCKSMPFIVKPDPCS
jgi:hypothetical protein